MQTALQYPDVDAPGRFVNNTVSCGFESGAGCKRLLELARKDTKNFVGEPLNMEREFRELSEYLREQSPRVWMWLGGSARIWSVDSTWDDMVSKYETIAREYGFFVNRGESVWGGLGKGPDGWHLLRSDVNIRTRTVADLQALYIMFASRPARWWTELAPRLMRHANVPFEEDLYNSVIPMTEKDRILLKAHFTRAGLGQGGESGVPDAPTYQGVVMHKHLTPYDASVVPGLRTGTPVADPGV